MTPILGHQPIMQRFTRLLQEQRLPHAWLLYGQQGIGKAMLAGQMAAAYFCESRQDDGLPCGQCHSCAMLRAESHPDFMHCGIAWNEKKKKFNRDIGVDQIREVLSFMAMSGSQSERRMVLLDDANAMNAASANGLLKGLEEPQAGSLLIIVCHDLTRLPATIRSRCMLEHCSPLQAGDVQSVLDHMTLAKNVQALAHDLAVGCPGRVQCLQDADLARAALAWHAILNDIAKADVGVMDDWLQKHVSLLPHDLIVAIVMLHLEEYLEGHLKESLEGNLEKESTMNMSNFDAYQGLLDTAESVLAWPAEVLRHSLRPAPALLSRILDVRAALKQCGS